MKRKMTVILAVFMLLLFAGCAVDEGESASSAEPKEWQVFLQDCEAEYTELADLLKQVAEGTADEAAEARYEELEQESEERGRRESEMEKYVMENEPEDYEAFIDEYNRILKNWLEVSAEYSHLVNR